MRRFACVYFWNGQILSPQSLSPLLSRLPRERDGWSTNCACHAFAFGAVFSAYQQPWNQPWTKRPIEHELISRERQRANRHSRSTPNHNSRCGPPLEARDQRPSLSSRKRWPSRTVLQYTVLCPVRRKYYLTTEYLGTHCSNPHVSSSTSVHLAGLLWHYCVPEQLRTLCWTIAKLAKGIAIGLSPCTVHATFINDWCHNTLHLLNWHWQYSVASPGRGYSRIRPRIRPT